MLNTFWRFVVNNLDKPWDWRNLSRRKDALEVAKLYPNFQWYWKHMSYDLCDQSLLELYPDKEWDWKHISSAKWLTIEFILMHSELPWDWESICESHEHICDHIDELHDHIVWKELSNNPRCTEQIIEKYI